MKLLSIREVDEFLGVSRTSGWRTRNLPGFPAPVVLLGGTKRWREADISSWAEMQRALSESGPQSGRAAQ